jgi:hypothetical protein
MHDAFSQRRSAAATSGLRLLALAATAALALAATSGAEATEITFDGLVAGPIGTTYTEKGYRFFNPDGDLFSWGVGGTHSFDHTPGSATLSQPYDFTATTLTRVGGGAFDLFSADFSDTNDTDNNFTYQFVFDFVGGTSLTRIIMLDEDFGPQTLDFDYHNLLSVTWGNDPGNDPFGLQWDNVRVSATPLPPALPLFVSALGALCWAGWRRARVPA